MEKAFSSFGEFVAEYPSYAEYEGSLIEMWRDGWCVTKTEVDEFLFSIEEKLTPGTVQVFCKGSLRPTTGVTVKGTTGGSGSFPCGAGLGDVNVTIDKAEAYIPLQTRLFALWPYDLFPYVLGGEVEAIDEDNDTITVRGYGQRGTRNVRLLPYKKGKDLLDRLTELGCERGSEIDDIAVRYDTKARDLIKNCFPGELGP